MSNRLPFSGCQKGSERSNSRLNWSADLDREMVDLRHEISIMLFQLADHAQSVSEKLLSCKRKRLAQLESLKRGRKKEN